MKRFASLAIVATIMIAGFTSCNKYEDGPSFTLKSAKSRLCREWKVKKVSEQVTVDEIDVTNFWASLVYTFNKSGDFTRTNNGVNSMGTWEFSDDKEELRLKLSNSTDVEVYVIRRLTSDDLWINRVVGSTTTKFQFIATE